MTESKREKNNLKAARYRERIRNGQPLGMSAAARAARPVRTEEEIRQYNRSKNARHRARKRAGEPITNQLHGGVSGFDEIAVALGLTERETRHAYTSAIKKLRKYGPWLADLLNVEHRRWPIPHP